MEETLRCNDSSIQGKPRVEEACSHGYRVANKWCKTEGLLPTTATWHMLLQSAELQRYAYFPLHHASRHHGRYIKDCWYKDSTGCIVYPKQTLDTPWLDLDPQYIYICIHIYMHRGAFLTTAKVLEVALPSPLGHDMDSFEWKQSTYQYSFSRFPSRYIETIVHPIHKIDVRRPWSYLET